jgi:hypothetical protein
VNLEKPGTKIGASLPDVVSLLGDEQQGWRYTHPKEALSNQ